MSKSNFDEYLDEQLKDEAFAERFRRAEQEWDLALEIARQREAAGLTQRELAQKIGTSQQQISRLERPNYRGSLTTLERVAEALNLTVEVRLHPKRETRKSARAAQVKLGPAKPMKVGKKATSR